ncbi:MAG: DUF4931 domain-containing protein [Coriobacteriia bacterium]|nr:DUF4931 domain-containing protein [Coriobacteriia bacterium]
MSELRRDPVTGIWTILAPGRAGRPKDFTRAADEAGDASHCPFCPGNEHLTPPSLLESSLPGSAGWTVRAFENLYPALEAAEDDDGLRAVDAPWPYTGQQGFGKHEVIVESPRHDDTLAAYEPAHAALLVDAWAQRIEHHRRAERSAAVILFRNFGRAAGASLAHPHTQLMALPRVPDALVRELGNFSESATEGRPCVLCAAVSADDAGGRIVWDDGVTVVHVPWAAPIPYLMRITPRECLRSLADATPGQRASFADALVAAAAALSRVFGDAAFNVTLHDAPFSAQRAGLPFHLHAEVVPRTSDQAGFEWASGAFMNVIDPDQAAAELRG